MTKQRILIIGAGYLGSHIAEYFSQMNTVTVLDKPEIDITSLLSLSRVIKKHRPDVIINAAAIADTHFAEKPENRDLTFKVNVQGPLNLAYLSTHYQFKLVHISTGMIFSGEKGEIASEETTPSPRSYYAWTKAFADAALLPFCENNRILITRIQLPISDDDHPRNLLIKLPQFERYLDEPRSFTVISDYCSALEQLLAQKQYGLYNIVNPEAISFLGIALLLQHHKLINAHKKLQSISLQQLVEATRAKGGAIPTDTVLDTTKLQNIGIKLAPIHEAVEKVIIQQSRARL